MPEAAPGVFKAQPWTLFDTVVAKSFLLGDETNGLAIGTQQPAINANGDIVFFAAGRTKAQLPWYTNIDLQGQLAYGMEVWQIYLLFAFPAVTPAQNNGYDILADPGVPPTVKLMEAILNFGVLDLDLGQEEQTSWPLTRFAAGGGLVVSNTAAVVVAQNAEQQVSNVMRLAEAIEMPRTQNVSAKIRLAPEARDMIGTETNPGVGSPLDPYIYKTENQVQHTLKQLPFSIQLGFQGRRIKKTQYGQVPGGPAPVPSA